MNNKQISLLLNSIGVSPNRKGYRFLVHLISLGTAYKGQPFPCIKDLYQQTADYFGVTASRVEYNVRTVVRCYWNQKAVQETFSSVTHYPVTENLSAKEFISVLAEYAANLSS